MEIYAKLFLSALLPVALTVAFTFLNKAKRFQKLPYMARQAIIGACFGLAAVFATEKGINLGAATANARDAAPLCAGLIFGAPAGIIAGLTGGIERWFAALWGAGMYSRLACTISTILAGLIAALLRKVMLDDHRPNWGIGLSIGVVVEVLHMTILFLTHLNDAEGAYEIVKICTFPMIFCNSVAVALSVVAAKLAERKLRTERTKLQNISTHMQRWLLILVVVAYFVTTAFVYTLQTKSARHEAEQLLRVNVNDFREELESLSDEEIIDTLPTRRIGSGGDIFVKRKDFVHEGSGTEVSRFGNAVFSKLEPDTLLRGKSSGKKVFILYKELENYLVIGVLPEAEAYSTRDRMTYINSYMEVIVFAVLFFLIYNLVKDLVTDNVHAVNKSLGKIIDGDLNEIVNVRVTEEFDSLSNDINSTVDTLKRYIEAEKTRISKELQYAKDIQSSALPSVFPAFPNRKDFEIYASMATAREVGGDFYDFYLLDQDRLVFLVADVSGKGIPAALFMMQAKTMLKNLTESGQPVNKVFSGANMKLLEANEAGMFVTVWMGILELQTGRVTFCNAGHNFPLIAGTGEDFDFHKVRPNLVLAGMEDAPYKLQELYLAPGDTIFLYTDGVTEATDVHDELFGDERLQASVNGHKGLSPEELVRAVRQDVDAFVGEREQFDDITMLVLQYNGKPEEEGIENA